MSFLWRRYRPAWWLVASLLTILLLAITFLLGSLLWRTWAGHRQQEIVGHERSIPNTDVNPFGANVFLGREVEPWKIDRTLHMASDAGLGWVKQHFPWEQIEPGRKGEFLDPQTKESSWANWDRIVEACEKYDLEIVARLDRPPRWTRADNTFPQRPPDNYDDYGDFVYEFVSRYRGRIRYIQVWNEPNIYPEWGNQAVDPAAYVELLKVAYRRAKEANPNVYVLSAPLAITLGEPHPEPNKWRSMNDLDYLTAMYEAGAADYFDIYSANAFGLSLPPDSPPDPSVLNFQRVVLHREIMEHYGDAHKAVWFNEYGWNVAPASILDEAAMWGRVTERQQAEYTLEGIRIAREEWPWAGVFMIWYLRQVGNITPDNAEYYFRMVDTDFTPRQVYFAVQDVAGAKIIAGAGLHQQTSPAIQRFGSWQHVIHREASGGSWIRSDRPGDSVSLAFQGRQVDLLTRTGPDGGRLLVSLDGHTVSGLPKDAQGASFVSLYSPTVQTGARIPLAENSGLGEHTLRLIVAPDADSASAGHAVVIDAFEVHAGQEMPFPTDYALGLTGGLAVTSALLWRMGRRLRLSHPDSGWRNRPPWR